MSQDYTYSNSSGTRYTFTVPALNTSTTGPTSHIWAFSHTRPGSSSASSPLMQHDASGTMQLDLTADLNAAPSTTRPRPRPTGYGYPTSAANGNGAGFGRGGWSRQSVLLAHVVCGALATMLFLPIGVLVPRIARGLTSKRWWFPVHSAVNGLVGTVLVVAAYGTARGELHRAAVSSVHRVSLPKPGPWTIAGRRFHDFASAALTAESGTSAADPRTPAGRSRHRDALVQTSTTPTPD